MTLRKRSKDEFEIISKLLEKYKNSTKNNYLFRDLNYLNVRI